MTAPDTPPTEVRRPALIESSRGIRSICDAGLPVEEDRHPQPGEAALHLLEQRPGLDRMRRRQRSAQSTQTRRGSDDRLQAEGTQSIQELLKSIIHMSLRVEMLPTYP